LRIADCGFIDDSSRDECAMTDCGLIDDSIHNKSAIRNPQSIRNYG